MERLRGEQALLVGDLDTALLALHAARAILPNDPDTEHALLRAAEAAMSMAGERLSSEGPLVAYPFAMRAARFGVHVPGLPELVAATRGGVEEQVRGLVEAGAFEQAHVQPFGVNPAGVQSHERYAEKFGFPFPLLSDSDREVADLYGALKSDGRKIHRSVVLIGQGGTVLFAARGAPPADEVLAALAGA